MREDWGEGSLFFSPRQFFARALLPGRLEQASLLTDLYILLAYKALEGGKDECEMDNGTLAIITPDQYDEACNIMANYFLPDNSLCKSFGVTWNELFMK